MAIELVGPKGWSHGWVAERPPATLEAARRATASKRGRAGLMMGMSEHPVTGDDVKSPTSAAGRRALAVRGLALKDGSFPVPNADYWQRAFQSVGRAKDPAKRAALARLLRKTAPQFGKTGKIKGSWLDTSNTGQRALQFAGPVAYYKHAGEDVECPYCHKMNENDAKYCDQCGKKLPASAFEHSNQDGTRSMDFAGETIDGVSCPNCGTMNDSAANYCDNCGHKLSAGGGTQTPAPSDLQAKTGMKANQLSNTGRALEFAGRQRIPATASDIVVARSASGGAVIRHRRGGEEMGQIRRENGRWVPVIDGKDGEARVHQRTAMLDLVSNWNRGAANLQRPAAGPTLTPPPAQTQLMQQLGIQNVRAFATPAGGTSDGPRMTSSAGSGGGGGDTAGLSPKGVAIYKKLKTKMPAARALMFARHAQNFGGKKK